MTGAIKIAIYENRIEIFSPGAFPGLITVDNIGDGTTFLRNPHLAKIARKFGLVEKMGSGARLIFDVCKRAKLRRPVYNEDGDFVKLTLFFEKELDQTLSVDKKILALLAQKGSIKIAEIVMTIGISRNSATRHMNRLVKLKKAIRIGKGPSTQFKI